MMPILRYLGRIFGRVSTVLGAVAITFFLFLALPLVDSIRPGPTVDLWLRPADTIVLERSAEVSVPSDPSAPAETKASRKPKGEAPVPHLREAVPRLEIRPIDGLLDLRLEPSWLVGDFRPVEPASSPGAGALVRTIPE